jgi:hypothetical protein
MAGKLSADFEVNIADAQRQGQMAGKAFGSGLSSGMATSTADIFSKQGMEDVERAGMSKGRTQAAKRWGWGQTGGNFLKTEINKQEEIQDKKLKEESQKTFRSKVQFYKDLTFLFQPLLNPTSVWGNMFAARQTFSAFNTEYGQNKIGGGGAAGALRATLLLQGAFLVTGLALKAFTSSIRFAADEVKKSFEFAHQLFGKALESGLSLRFNAQRQMTASVLGVNENDIFRFAQSASVMRQLSGAVNEISKDAPQIAYYSSQFKIMEFNVLALGSKITIDLLPAIKNWLDGMNMIVQWFGNHIPDASNKAGRKVFGAFADDGKVGITDSKGNPVNESKTVELARKLMSSFGVTDPNKMADLMMKANPETFKNIINKTTFDSNPKINAADKGILTKLFNDVRGAKDGNTLGQPQSFMKQLPVGAFEKMGLIIGGGMADKALEYQRRTATAVEKLYQAATKTNQKTSGYYMGRPPQVAGY